MTEEQRPVSVVVPTPAGRSPRQPNFLPGIARHPGRPGYLTREVEAQFMDAIRAGSSIHDAAEYAGLNPKTVEGWLYRGRGHNAQYPDPGVEYIRFARLYTQNRATARVYTVGNMVAASAHDWRAGDRWLRVHGGPEWRNESALVPSPVDGAVQPQQSLTIDAREQQMNVIVLPPDQVPDVVKHLLAMKRANRVDAPVSDEEEVPHDGPSATRDAGLRDSG